MKRVISRLVVVVCFLLTACVQQKRNNLYLYFPTSSDSTFPEYNDDYDTSPLAEFDVADLDSGIGTTAQLRDRIFEIVETDYYEFDVDVSMSTTKPNPTGARWQIVGIGSDSVSTVSGGITYYLFGVAQAVDTGDSDAQDYARVYADSFGEAYGGSGGALNGTDSTLDRWATAIGHTTSHEAGHNYGLSHANSAPVSGSGEDKQTNHILATGSSGLTGEIRASVTRHFSDTSYEILGHNLGLSINTLYNWDFTNPNNKDAHSLEITILSEASTLTIDWFYTGNRSPWTNPTVASTGSTQTFQGKSYKVYELTFSTGTGWCCGSNGVVTPGQDFHIGVTFKESDPVVVYETTLKDNAGSDLPLHPRTVGFDNGSADMATGDFALAIFNPNPEQGDIIIEELTFLYLPRLLYIDSMVADAKLQDYRGIQVLPYLPKEIEIDKQTRPIEISEQTTIVLGNLSFPRHVDITYDATGCKRGFIPPADVDVGEIEYCPEGTALSLFPATSVYVVAKIIDPDAEYFDPEVGEFVNGPLESWVYYQFTGFIPDFNDNGIDDLLDIRDGTSEDKNRNGIPDEAEG
jgi:hypothetical protein